MGHLKPNRIARTVYPEQPCTDYSEWTAHITSREISREVEAFKKELHTSLVEFFEQRMEAMFSEFQRQLKETYEAES